MRSLEPPLGDRGRKPPPDPQRKRRRPRVLAGGVLAVAVLAAIAVELPENPTPSTISGSPRLKLTSGGEFVRWRNSNVELTIDPAFEQLGAGTRDVVALAYATWTTERAHLPALTIDLASTTRHAELDGVNLVTYAPIDIAGHQSSLGVTVAYLLEDGTITEVDTIINSKSRLEMIGRHASTNGETPDHPATDDDHNRDDHQDDDRDGGERSNRDTGHTTDPRSHDCVRSYDLQSVLTHEAGHFFGLGEDEENREATMYYRTGRCETKQRDLSDDDVAAIETVYAEPTITKAGEGTQPAACATAPGARGRAFAWAFPVVLGSLRVARRIGARGSRA